jgi:hypothetical protein
MALTSSAEQGVLNTSYFILRTQLDPDKETQTLSLSVAALEKQPERHCSNHPSLPQN